MKFQIFGTKKGVCNINVSFLKNGRKERQTRLARNLLPPVKKPGNEPVVRAARRPPLPQVMLIVIRLVFMTSTLYRGRSRENALFRR